MAKWPSIRVAPGVIVGGFVLVGAVFTGPVPLANASVPASTQAGVAPAVEPDPSAPDVPDPPAIQGPPNQGPANPSPPVHHYRSHHRPPTST